MGLFHLAAKVNPFSLSISRKQAVWAFSARARHTKRQKPPGKATAAPW